MNSVVSGASSVTTSRVSSEAARIASNETASEAGRGANSKASSGASVVLRVNFAGPNRGLVASRGEIFPEPQMGGRGATSHRGEDCSSEPIKDVEDVRRVCRYFADSGNNLMLTLFVLGVNTAYRISDILSLRWEEVAESEGTVSETSEAKRFHRPEKKTDKRRLVYLNDTAQAALANWRAECGDCAAGYVFASPRKPDAPVTRQYVDRQLKQAVADLGIAAHAGTHLMRKTFAYHHILQAKDRSRALEQLMLLLNHSNIMTTLRYAGITKDEIAEAYHDVQLGEVPSNSLLQVKRIKKGERSEPEQAT